MDYPSLEWSKLTYQERQMIEFFLAIDTVPRTPLEIASYFSITTPEVHRRLQASLTKIIKACKEQYYGIEMEKLRNEAFRKSALEANKHRQTLSLATGRITNVSRHCLVNRFPMVKPK